MITRRLRRICAITWVLCLLLGAAAAEEPLFAVPQGTDTVDGEQIIYPGELPDEIQKLLDTAIGELGYTELSDGYSKYGAWTGDPYSEWCAEFVCWCVNMTDQLYGYKLLKTVYPYYTGQNTGRDWFVARGRFVFRRAYSPGWGWQWLKDADGMMETNDYIPLPGDLVFFSYNSSGDTVHVALVEYCAYGPDGSVWIHVIEGNNPQSVKRSVYALDNSQVLGFGCWLDVVDTTIQFGNTGDKVLKLQQNLGKLGYLNERHFTSTYLSNTRDAVSKFQRTVMGVTPTGIADRDTQLAIQREVDRMNLFDPEAWLVTEDTE
ncbi:MAG TPA: peptidoglycan-binding protein [Candidatus Limiplasma sp.]|nr:peptidoglycan-binding protein [Candidatus Limiplasma sp.]